MKNWLKKIYFNRYFLLFIMLFGYVESIYIRVAANDEINIYMFTPEAALLALLEVGVLYIVILFFIKKWQRSGDFSTKETVKIFASSLFVFPLIMQAVSLCISFIFNNIDRNFNQETLFYTTFTFFLQGFTYGSFFLAYFYYKRNKNHQQQLANFHQALSESRINQLKAQINPHFLFNNLNILDQLIEEDKHKASDFLNEFAEIYRYVLQASDKKLISMEEEMIFAERYFRLIQHKYGKAYQMKIESKNSNGYIVPLALQLLIENAVQHNMGTEENPVCIRIEAAENISVTNNTNLKRNAKSTYGRALNNLKEQYKLLTKEPIEIQHFSHSFSVVIPIIDTYQQ